MRGGGLEEEFSFVCSCYIRVEKKEESKLVCLCHMRLEKKEEGNTMDYVYFSH